MNNITSYREFEKVVVLLEVMMYLNKDLKLSIEESESEPSDDSDDSDDLVTSTPYGDIRSKSNKKEKQEDENPTVNSPGDALGIFDDSSAGATSVWNFDLWGSDEEEGLESGEKRYRIKLIGSGEGSKVYVESADGLVNNSRAANAIVNILFEHLR